MPRLLDISSSVATLAVAALVALAPRPAWALCQAATDPDCVTRRMSMTGTIDFFATGASLTANDDADDRPDRALDLAEVTVPAAKIPTRATLVKAYLYFGGSLFADDDGDEDPDLDVELQVPGSSAFAPVHADQLHRSGPIAAFPELTLYTARADVTDVLKNAGGQMVGTYRLRGFTADVFYGGTEHTAANASFSIILVFEEPRLPPRTIALFDGMQEVLGSTVTLDLSGFTVSQVPSGSLTLYAEEGDCNPGPNDCAHGNNLSGNERIRVIGADPSRTLILSDPVNPPNDVFNHTINTVDPPLTDVLGVDIDGFDITPVLRAGDTGLHVEITTPLPSPTKGTSGELIGLVYVVVGIDVFAPELRVDSRIDVRTDRGEQLPAYYPGDPLRVTYEVSNTGNLPATEVKLTADMPADVTRYEVASVPAGARLTNDPAGGAHGRGQITVENISVRQGEVSSLVVLAETTCPLASPEKFEAQAAVSAAKEGGVPFSMTSSVAILARDRCGPRFYLYGGGGCQDVKANGGGAWWLGVSAALVALLFAARRRLSRSSGLFAILFALAGSTACGGNDAQPDRPPPEPIATACPNHDDMVVVPSVRGAPSFCIDRYEASIASGDLGNKVQPDTDRGDGSTTAVAQSKRFVLPARGLTWFQANVACRNANKRLCSANEWGTACGGSDDLTYPYGDGYDGSRCNGYDAIRGDVVEAGAMIVAQLGSDGVNRAMGCVSPYGAYDLSGNVWEWNGTAYFDRARRGLVGGSFRSNRVGLRCVTEDNHALPAEENDAFGFRCCVDAP